MRYIDNLKRKVNGEQLVLSNYVNACEMVKARRLWILDNQASIPRDKNFCNLVRNLNLLTDDEGMLRSFSRLKNANIPYDSKAPVFIHRQHRLAELIVYNCHEKVMHQGTKDTLTELRSMFWVTRGVSFVNKLLHPCKTCRVLNARPYEYPNFSELPDLRFDEGKAFSSTGCTRYIANRYTVSIKSYIRHILQFIHYVL